MKNTSDNSTSEAELHLNFGITFTDLFESGKLKHLSGIFSDYLKNRDENLHSRFSDLSRNEETKINPVEKSRILIETARYIENFIAELFGIEDELANLKKKTEEEKIILTVKRDFIHRKVFKIYKTEDLPSFDYYELNNFVENLKREFFKELDWGKDEEYATAEMIYRLTAFESSYKNYLELNPPDYEIPGTVRKTAGDIRIFIKNSKVLHEYFPDESVSETKRKNVPAGIIEEYFNLQQILEVIRKWCFAGFHDKDRKEEIKNWVLFRLPHEMNYSELVHNKIKDSKTPELIYGSKSCLRKRDGFKLTDERYSNREVMSEVQYCVFCHEREKDSCSTGLKDKDGSIRHNPLGIKLEGCPLDEKISEMHFLKNEGRSLAALSMIMIDNPMCPGTGHRICNDCMKACIYQKQEPVNIPQIETKILNDVLGLPYGFEIYSLLTRWNPLNISSPFEKPYNGKNILVVGLGPAGYTLSQHLLNEGFGVIGIDGLKIEKIHKEYSGYTDEKGAYTFPKPLKFFNEIKDELDERIFLGFGGVSEYGITVRWDKNFLKVVYLSLARRKHFRYYDGVRFGGTIEIEDAWETGFDHIAIATGAGKPTLLKMKNNLIRGFRMASDFLMALQLTGAAKRDSIANLMIQLPVVVIGGGLTAIDTATESMAYYPVQVEKFLGRYEIIIKEFGEEKFWNEFDEEEKIVAKKFIEHGKAIREERINAKALGMKPDFIPLLRLWGGVTIAYRKSLNDSPAYRLNHEEIIKSLEEGIYFRENLSPVEALQDEYGAVKALTFRKQVINSEGRWTDSDEIITLPARTVLVAAGTSPNVIYEREHQGTFEMDEWNQYFRTYKIDKTSSEPRLIQTGKGETGFFTSYNSKGKYITVYGDNHPVYAGNVVKAMASARDGHKEILKLFGRDRLTKTTDQNEETFRNIIKYLDENLIAKIERINILTSSIVEVVVKAPLQAKKFRPGQFYRLQNYETDSVKMNGTTLLMEGLALTGAWVDTERGLLGMIVLEMGGSSSLVRYLKKGQRVVVMGPTGSPTEIPEGENVLLAGGGLGNAVLFSIAKALKKNGNRVLYFAGYKKSSDLFKQEEVEEATDQVIWSNDFGDVIKPRRQQDRTIKANIIQSMVAYSQGRLEQSGVNPMFDFKKIHRIIAIGSDKMMKAVKEARHGILKDVLNQAHIGIASINSTMQCMMKEVCAQCLQKHVDPVTGKEFYVFSCFNQDQEMDFVDFANLNERLKSNSVLEKETRLWLEYIIKKEHV